MAVTATSKRVMLSEDFMLPKDAAWRLGMSKRMGDLSQGGQNGISPDLRYHVANSSYVSRPVNAVLIAAPRLFTLLPGANYFIGSLKALVETWAEEWTGLNSTLTVEYVDTVVGASEMQQDVARVARARSEPQMKVSEKNGLTIHHMLDTWIQMGMGSPESMIPGIVAYLTQEKNAEGLAQYQYLPDWLAMTVLFYETTPEGTDIQKAWLCTNMMPFTSGEITGERNLQNGGQKLEHSIQFTCTQQVGVGVMRLAKKIHNSLNLGGVNPTMRRAFVGDDLDDLAREAGYRVAGIASRQGASDTAFTARKMAQGVNHSEPLAGYKAQASEVAADMVDNRAEARR